MDVTDPCVSCGMQQRIPTLNLNLILNPKLDLISKLITVALLPTRPRDPIYTHSHSRISTLSHTHTLVCRPIVRCWEGHLGPSQSKRARVHATHAPPSPPGRKRGHEKTRCTCALNLGGEEAATANSTVMVARNPAFRQKAPGIRGGVWGKNHLIQVKDSQ